VFGWFEGWLGVVLTGGSYVCGFFVFFFLSFGFVFGGG